MGVRAIYTRFVCLIQWGNNYFHLKTERCLDGDEQHARAPHHTIIIHAQAHT